MFRRALVILSGLTALAGCDLSGAPPQVSLTAGAPSMMAAGAALTATGDELLGPQPALAGIGGIGGFGGAGGLTGTPYRHTRAEAVTLRIRQHHDLNRQVAGGDLALVGTVALGSASQAWHLPRGIGVLVDPLNIRVDSRLLETEARLQWARPVTMPAAGPARVELYAGAGALHARSQTQLRSALLAIDHASSTTQPYLVAGATLLTARRRAVQAALDLRVTASRGSGVEAGLHFGLRH